MVNRIPHGGGLQGRANCPCELCREKNREYQRNWARAKTGGGSREDLRVPHGGGARGRRNCKCDLCTVRRRQYDREFRHRRRVQKRDQQRRDG